MGASRVTVLPVSPGLTMVNQSVYPSLKFGFKHGRFHVLDFSEKYTLTNIKRPIRAAHSFPAEVPYRFIGKINSLSL
jgi:hypothetical protein